MNDKIQPILKIINKFRSRTDRASLLSDLFSICAYNISNAVDGRSRERRKKELEAVLKKYNDEEIELLSEAYWNIVALCSECTEPNGEFYDFLGDLYMTSLTSSKSAGQFFTPFEVARLTAMPLIQHAIETEPELDIITIDEPACGSGGLLLAFLEGVWRAGINYTERIFIHAADLDDRCSKMCYTQLSLAGVPAIVHRRNTLTMETFDVWYTPAYCFNYLKFRKFEGTV